MSFGKLRIGDIFNIEKGSLQSTKCVPGKYNFITAAEGWKTHKEFTHNCEALLFAAAASGSLGRTHYVNGKFVGSDLCLILTPKDSKNYPLDLKFYNSVFNTFRKEIVSKTKSGTSKEAISIGKFAEYELQYFDLDHQMYWKHKLGKINYEKDDLEKELSFQLIILSKLRQQILQDAVQGKLVPQDPKDQPATVLLEKIKTEKEKLIKKEQLKKQKPLPLIKDEEIPFKIPMSWVWCRFCDIAIIESNLVSPFDYPNMPHVAPDNILKHRGKLLKVNTVLEDSVKSANHYFFAGQLVYSKVRPQLNKVVEVDFEGLCSADMYPIIPLINRKFLLYTMLAEYFLNEVNKFDNRVKMPKINQNQLSKIPLPVPPLDEQIRIARKIETLLNMCDDLEKEIKQNQKLSQQLLQSALKEALEPK